MAPDQQHPDPNLLAAFAEGNLAGSERARVLRHVDACPRCFAIYRDTLEYTGHRDTVVAFPHSRGSRIAFWTGLAAAATILLFWGIGSLVGEEKNWQRAEWWLAKYGAISAEDPVAIRARTVFDRVRQGVPGAEEAELLLLEGKGEHLAVALPGQGVLLSRGSIERCLAEVDPQTGDARLALVVAHELAHFREEEDVHAFAAFQMERGGNAVARTRNRAADLHQKELHADQWGLVYAAQAGFDPRLILNEADTFFRKWSSDTVTVAAFASHPDAETRARYLRDELAKVAADLDYFHYALRFYQMGRFPEARTLLETFQERYAGREVRNNLGLIELQSAIRVLSECDGAPVLRFMLPMTVDAQSLAEGARRRGQSESSICLENPEFLQRYRNAIDHFQAALAQDPHYEPALLNLFSAYVLVGDAAAAFSLSSRIEAEMPDSPESESVKGLALYLFGREKGQAADVAEAIESIRKTFENDPDPALAYNLAAMLEETGSDATRAWRQFLAMERFGPHADEARERLGGQPPPPVASEIPEPDGLLMPGPMTERERTALASIAKNTLNLNGSRTLTAWAGPSLRVLAEGDRILLVERRLSPPKPMTDFPDAVGVGRRMKTTRGPVLIGRGWILELAGQNAVKIVRFAVE